MSKKIKKIISWVLAGLVGLIFIGSATQKLLGSEEAIIMAEGFGLNKDVFFIIGIIELASAILFIIPRTGILGFLLLVAYMGGAIATHLEHGESIAAPFVVAAFVWIAAIVRFPVLKHRILGNSATT